MARKRKGLEHLSYESPEYWNRVLAREGLSMNAGLAGGRLVYVGTGTVLEAIDGARRTDTGRIKPAPHLDPDDADNR